MKKLTRILALVLVLVMSICVFTGCAKMQVEDVAKDFLNYVSEGNIDMVVVNCVNDYYVRQNAVDCAILNAGMEYKITDIKVDGDKAVVKVKITLPYGGESYEGTLQLVKDNKWEIFDIDI